MNKRKHWRQFCDVFDTILLTTQEHRKISYKFMFCNLCSDGQTSHIYAQLLQLSGSELFSDQNIKKDLKMSLQETADLVIFTGEILNGKLHFLSSVCENCRLNLLLCHNYVFGVLKKTQSGSCRFLKLLHCYQPTTPD